MIGILPIFISFAFLIVSMTVLLALWRLSRPAVAEKITPIAPSKQTLDASDILGWEFEYARTTASEAMQERHTIMNFYLLVVAAATSGIVAVLSKDSGLPPVAGTVLLWMVCGIGWVYFLMIIRLRQAWYGSAQAMNQIKEFYIQNAQNFDPDTFRKAFLFRTNTVPRPDKPWTIYFYSATLIGFLDSVALVMGGLLLDLKAAQSSPRMVVGLGIFGILFFAFHVRLYFALLRPADHDAAASASNALAKDTVMAPGSVRPDDPQTWVQILERAEVYSFEKFRIILAKLQYRRFDGRMSAPVTRINFDRGDSVGVLLYDPSEDTVILVRQFRYPVYESLDPTEQTGAGARQAWLLEIVAGVKETDLTVKQVANKELLEEAGYEVVGDLQPIATVYPSPGGSSERITLFLGEADQRRQSSAGGGVVAEGEDTQIVALPFHEAIGMVARGEIVDAKTIVALQYLALRKAASVPSGLPSPAPR